MQPVFSNKYCLQLWSNQIDMPIKYIVNIVSEKAEAEEF